MGSADHRGLECGLAHANAEGEDYQQGGDDTHGGSGLDPARVEAALAIRRMLRDVGRMT